MKKLQAGLSQVQLQLQNTNASDTKLRSKSPTARSPTAVTSLPLDTLKSRSHTNAVGTSLPVGMKPRPPTSIVTSSLNPFQFPPTLESSPSPSHTPNSSISPSHHSESSLSPTTTNLTDPPSKDEDQPDNQVVHDPSRINRINRRSVSYPISYQGFTRRELPPSTAQSVQANSALINFTGNTRL